MPKHVHKYHRLRIGKNEYEIYKCALAGCTHYVQAELVVGRKSICWRCGNEFIITGKLRHKKPHCEDCIQSKTAKLGEKALEVLSLRGAFLGDGGSDLTKPAAHILKILVMRPDHKKSRISLLRELLFEADAAEMDKVISIFLHVGVLETSKAGRGTVYVMKQSAVEKLHGLVQAEG